jgi:hypothetical protein
MEGAPTPGTDLVLARPTGTKTRDWPPAPQCGGTRSDGEPCHRRATRGGDRCAVHGAQLPSVRQAYARRVEEARMRIVTLADPALDALERALADKDSGVAVRAAQAVLDRVVPKPQAGVSVVVGLGETAAKVSPSEVIRARLAALREAQQRAPDGDLRALSWGGEPLEGDVLDALGAAGRVRDDGDGDDWH